jgi:cell division protein FtsL
MASRLLSDTLITFRNTRQMPTVSALPRAVAWRVMAVVTLVGILMFLYLAEVSQVTTTTFDIELMQVEYQQWQERNQKLEEEISQLESPQHVLRYAEAHGMVPRTDAQYLTIQAGQ